MAMLRCLELIHVICHGAGFASGFASLVVDANASAGSLLTRPMQFDSKSRPQFLFVNVALATGDGGMAVALLQNGSEVPGFRAIDFECLALAPPGTDDTWLGPLRWSAGDGDLTTQLVAGTPFQLRVVLFGSGSAIFSFWVSASTCGESRGATASGGPGLSGAVDTAGRCTRRLMSDDESIRPPPGYPVATATVASSFSVEASKPSPVAGSDLTHALHIGNASQLFIDDLIIASTVNLSRSVHSPDCARVAIRADADWEKNLTIGLLGASLIADGGKLRLWYPLRNSSVGCRPAGVSVFPASGDDRPNCSSHNPPEPNLEAAPLYLAYAESADGGHSFTKPLLHLYSFQGSTANNILGEWTVFSVFIDPAEPTGSPRRYRSITGNQALKSADGLRWTRDGEEGSYELPTKIPGNKGHGSYDTATCLFFDPPCQCYSCYTRWEDGDGGNSRMIRRARSLHLDITGESNNSIGHWVNQSVVMGADALDTATHAGTQPVDYYGSTTWYSPAANMYLMAAVRFFHWGPDRNGPRTKDIALASSR
jgi:hypothetical protein